MPTSIDICNAALLSLGGDLITSLDENSNGAILCKQFYATTRDELLRLHPWNFAKTRASLTEVIIPVPAFGWDNGFTLPTDPYCLRVWRMEDPTDKFDVEGRTLLTDQNPANIVYVKRVEDPNEFDALFIECLELKLAVKLAFPLTKNQGTATAMENLFRARLIFAKGINGQERNTDETSSNTFIDVRDE